MPTMKKPTTWALAIANFIKTIVPFFFNHPKRRRPVHHQTGFDFQAYVSEKSEAVNKALDEAVLLGGRLAVPEAMRYSLLAEVERVCPVLCLAACELVGGNQSSAISAACASEMIYVATLILDDLPCMANADLRSGRPTAYKAFGEAAAVLASVGFMAAAFELVAAATRGVSSARLLRAVGELAQCTGAKGLVVGLAAEIESASSVGVEQLEFIHVHKTAVLLEGAAVMGAIIGGGSDEDVERLRSYARCIGLMYRVVDDILDVTKSTEELRKTVDLGTATYPKVMGIDKSKELAMRLNKEAKDYLASFDPQNAAPLISLADYIASRQN